MTREPMWRRYDRFFGANRRKDADEEIAFHFEMRVQDYMKHGLSEAEARAAASERLGDIETTRAQVNALADLHTRKDRQRTWFSEITQDIRYGLRMLVRAPSFTLVAVLTLALGIGATTSIFSVVHRVLIAPLPYADAERIVFIYEKAPNGQDDENLVSSGNYIDWRGRAKSFSAIGAFSGLQGLTLDDRGEPTRVTTAALTPSALAALNVRPVIGRLFAPEDAAGGPVAIISEAFWRGRFASDTAVLYKSLLLNDVSYPIIGVMPASVEFPSTGVDIWRALRNNNVDPEERQSHSFNVIARLAPGVTLDHAQSEMTGIARVIASEHPRFMNGWGVNVKSFRGALVQHARPLLLVLIGAVSVVLLIACANLANLLLARAVAREREFVLRGALGARRSRLVRQLLTESVLVATLGGALGLAAAALTLRSLLALAPPIPFGDQTRVDFVVIAFAAGLTLLSTTIFGLAPALRLSRVDLQGVLRTTTGSSSSGRDVRLRGALLVSQIALSVVLLVGAGLLVRSFGRLQSVALGYRADDLAMMQLNLPGSRYQGIAQQSQFYDALIARLATVPRVQRVTAASLAPTRPWQTFSYTIEGRVATNPNGRETPIPMHWVLGNYFGTLELPLKRGRVFDARDRVDAPAVVIVNESFAKLHWPGEDPVGKLMRRGSDGPWSEVVGLVADARMNRPTDAPTPLVYMPYEQRTVPWMSLMSVLMRVDPDVDATSLLPALRAAVRDVDARLPVQEFTTVNALYKGTIERRSFAMILVTLFGVLALALSTLGLYGLISYDVAQQRREIGVRIALGASQPKIVGRILGRAIRLVGLGLTIGLAGAAGLTRWLESLLYSVSPLDTMTFVATAVLVAVIALVATYVPAVRAAGTSPLVAMRS